MHNDQAAYRAGMIQVFREGVSRKLDKIDNIQVNGDAATANTTTTDALFSAPPKTETDHSQAVREHGRWTDCTRQNAR